VELFSEPYLTVPGANRHSYDVAADGRFLMIQRAAGSADLDVTGRVIVVQNWVEELRRLTSASE
jgi:hypothetical protein